MRLSIFVFALVSLAMASASKVLVLLESENQKTTHKNFLRLFGSKAGYEPEYRLVGDKNLKLKDWDQWLYDHLVILAPRAKGKSCRILFLSAPAHGPNQPPLRSGPHKS